MAGHITPSSLVNTKQWLYLPHLLVSQCFVKTLHFSGSDMT